MNIKRKCNRLTYIALLGISLATSASCSKSDSPTEPVVEPPKEEESNADLFNRLVQVRNFAATDKNDGNSAAPTVYYSLETNKGIPETHRQTRNWDIAFSNIFNSHVSGNNGSNNTNFGYGNNATGGILIVEKAFDEVIEIPADSEFKVIGDAIGMDQNGDEGNGIGWLLYDFYGRLVREHAVQNEHVAYALGNGLTLQNGKVIKPRTLIIRTAKGNYAKIRPLSMYKDLLTADKWFKDSPHVFISFDYVLAPKGSTTFEIKP
ncbi:HmuY family protein [Sphingobacterium sp. N143]|uniref:HmuY family protein n=1 Tax=Sphingobacterium sp. N143 TaxID=2746727 RepID=UPI002577F4C2|nr:HmuY family protein [Sphingobacterium sp. N143]MDM1296417.1 HmuY family protein [Sphingobacterium sp. N143]